MVGVWKTIATINSHLALFNVSLEKVITGLVGNGSSIRFWVDTWIDGSPLRETYPDLYKLERHKGCFINERCTGRGRFTQWEWNWVRPPSSHNELFELQNLITQVIHLSLSASNDTWEWKYDTSGFFTTKSMKSLLQSTTYGPTHWKFPWNHLAPLKVNIFGWRLEMNRIPTRDQLLSRNITLTSAQCPLCNSHDESAPHLFLQCDFANSLWLFLLSWCNIYITKPSSLRELFEIHTTTHLGSTKSSLFNLVILAYCWIIWKLRNECIFKNKTPSFRFAAKEIKSGEEMCSDDRN
ncbi:reverse transcriptase domain, Reverse transcriptase zinc-binding domain protein [Artemisia annua]|uniref:Reverse transcriptase domain, Reverse transcriptase zinc-binding domain protein n=1 Tax=Artemisia annua TaxID=35608 RepID=A0A2U1MNG9_ARTAN|nr:reverse transcriptase domain, Reverse transcriptase zinc-binding domain protein [Artemisia annua]